MKVGTDGVLLGSWARGERVSHILDIGTGTGLIALMMAQRFPEAHITAIEPQPDAHSDALLNFSNSPFSERLQLHSSSMQDFAPRHKYDLIVCNPPFFQHDLPAPDQGRNMARHARSLRPAELVLAGNWLSAHGNICGIYPFDVYSLLEQVAIEAGLHLQRLCYVRPRPQKPAKRVLFSFVNTKSGQATAEKTELVIETGLRHQYSDEFISLLKDFYLYL